MLPWFLLSLLITGVDQLTKALVSRSLVVGEMIEIIPGLLTLTYLHNPGAAFGLLANQTALLAAVSAGVIGAALVYRDQFMAAPPTARFGVFLALGGALGNLIDRIRLKAVTDFIYVPHFSVFNVADIAICTGVGLIALAVILDGKRNNDGDPSSGTQS